MKHPNEAELALFAGHDLNFVSEWLIRSHIARCERCRETADVFSSLRSEVATLKDLPSDIGWNRLASEMKANIRVGLEAGECVGAVAPADTPGNQRERRRRETTSNVRWRVMNRASFRVQTSRARDEDEFAAAHTHDDVAQLAAALSALERNGDEP